MSLPRSSPRILYLSPPWAYRAIRSFHIARALAQVGKVDIVIVHAEDSSRKSIPDLESEFNILYELEVALRQQRSLTDKIASATGGNVPFPHGVGVSDCDDRRLQETIRNYDLIWFFKLRTANMFARQHWPHSVLDIDDLPSGFYRTAENSSRSVKENLACRFQVKVWQRRERRLDARFSVLATCSDADKNMLKSRVPTHAIPNGFERPTAEPVSRPVTPPRIGFIGLFDYIANVEGVRWFAERCWPLIQRELPEARLRLMGRGSDGTAKPAGTNIDGLGWVDDSAAEIATWSVMIVPLFLGGGTRVKIAEGFSRACPIVSTTVGAYGYEVENGQQLLLADEPAEFASACCRLITDRTEATAMAARAWDAFQHKWSWETIAPRVWAAAEDGLRLRP